MAISEMQAEFLCSMEKLWDMVTSPEHYSWRSDISKIVVVEPGKRFEEHTRDGYVTTFTITAFEKYRRYEFDMENENMRGHWTGIFLSEGDKVRVTFIEDVTCKKIFMRPFVKGYLKKQQARYFADLRNAVEFKIKK